MRALTAIALGALSTACSGALADGDGRAFGEDLGRFQVTARLDSSTCGPGALGAPDPWQFEVVLSRSPPDLFWNTGADAVTGTIGDDGRTFSFASQTATNSGGDAGRGVCTITRVDTAQGTFDDDAHPQAMTGVLTYAFDQAGLGECGSAVAEAELAGLPCSMDYRFSASRISAR